MRPIHYIAEEIIATWRKLGKGLHPTATPYLSAMRQFAAASDSFGHDSGDMIVRYALANMKSFRGADARRLKAELKQHIGA